MALTPEDVVNKRFQPTKFREGYDQDEVDDFLDEVVVELRRLGQENEELRQRVAQADARVAEAQRQAAAAPAPAAAAAPAPAVTPEPTPAPAYQAPSVDPLDSSSTNNLLQLARRLHEEHVREGVEKRDALIAEGHATAARIVAEAEAKQRAQLSTLDQERVTLERRIEDLRSFERDYRTKLRGYIESQLRDLEAPAPVSTPTSQPSPAVLAERPQPAAPQPAGVYGGATPPANYPGFGSGR